MRRAVKGSEQPILLKAEPGLLFCQVDIGWQSSQAGLPWQGNIICVFYQSLYTETFYQEMFDLSKATLTPRVPVATHSSEEDKTKLRKRKQNSG